MEGIRFLVEGKEERLFGAGGFKIDGAFPSRFPGKNKTMLYLPFRSGGRYFLLPREAVQLGDKFNTPGDLLKILLEESRQFLPVAPELKEIKASKEENYSGLGWLPFQKLFPAEGTPEEKTLATLFGFNPADPRQQLSAKPCGYLRRGTSHGNRLQVTPLPVMEFSYPFISTLNRKQP